MKYSEITTDYLDEKYPCDICLTLARKKMLTRVIPIEFLVLAFKNIKNSEDEINEDVIRSCMRVFNSVENCSVEYALNHDENIVNAKYIIQCLKYKFSFKREDIIKYSKTWQLLTDHFCCGDLDQNPDDYTNLLHIHYILENLFLHDTLHNLKTKTVTELSYRE